VDRETVQRIMSLRSALTHDPPMPRKPINVRDFLSNLPLFRELSAGEIARMAAGSLEIDAPRGTVLVHRGEPCRNGTERNCFGFNRTGDRRYGRHRGPRFGP